MTEVDVCNIALVSIGSSKITSLSDLNNRAVVCNEWYETIRDNVFDLHNWSCLIQRATLGFYTGVIVDTGITGPLFDTGFAGLPQGMGVPNSYGNFDYVYALPETPKVIRILEVSDEVLYPYVVEKDLLFTNDGCDDIHIRYIAQIKDPNLWTRALVECVALRLAETIAIPITGDRQIREDMKAAYNLALIRHGIQNYRGQGGASKIDADGDILGAR